MRRIITRAWRYLEADPGPISSLVTFIIAALALGALLNALAEALP
jgi:hypothetical protein